MLDFSSRRLVLALLALALALTGASVSVPALARSAEPALVRVRLVTSDGDITVAVDTRRAPITSANFLAYVDDGRFDGTTFYRAARRKTDTKLGFIQGGIHTEIRRSLAPIKLERTDQTGIKHIAGTLSMAHSSNPNSAMGNFVITVSPTPAMDALGAYPGYAAFGHVVSGIATVRRILAHPTGGGTGPMRGQMILQPVQLIRAVRLDGKPKPTGLVKPWLIRFPDKKPTK